jgi:hypothetical protein
MVRLTAVVPVCQHWLSPFRLHHLVIQQYPLTFAMVADLCSGFCSLLLGDTITIFGSSTDSGGDTVWATWDKYSRKDVLVDPKCTAVFSERNANGLHAQVRIILHNGHQAD